MGKWKINQIYEDNKFTNSLLTQTLPNQPVRLYYKDTFIGLDEQCQFILDIL